MLENQDDEEIELECPECGAHVRSKSEDLRSGIARCPNGHEFAVAAVLGSVEDTRTRR